MNDCNIHSQRHIYIWIAVKVLTKCLVSLVETIFRQYDVEIIFAYCSDSSIHIQMKPTPAVAVHDNIMISRYVNE